MPSGPAAHFGSADSRRSSPPEMLILALPLGGASANFSSTGVQPAASFALTAAVGSVDATRSSVLPATSSCQVAVGLNLELASLRLGRINKRQEIHWLCAILRRG